MNVQWPYASYLQSYPCVPLSPSSISTGQRAVTL